MNNNNNKDTSPPQKSSQAHLLPKEQCGEWKKHSVTPASKVTDSKYFVLHTDGCYDSGLNSAPPVTTPLWTQYVPGAAFQEPGPPALRAGMLSPDCLINQSSIKPMSLRIYEPLGFLDKRCCHEHNWLPVPTPNKQSEYIGKSVNPQFAHLFLHFLFLYYNPLNR
jgi:hypothetical protein